MQLMPMNMPAEIHRQIEDPGHARREVVVAKGPLVIMAHGLCAIDPALRPTCWITSAAGDLSAEQAEEVLRAWSSRVAGSEEAA